MLLSRSYSTYRESCSTPFFSHSYEFCVCKLFRFTYFPEIMHLCQNNGFQSLQNHILTHAVSPTPLESHTCKIRGRGGAHPTSNFKPPTSNQLYYGRKLTHGS